jgi:hypothetical protein
VAAYLIQQKCAKCTWKENGVYGGNGEVKDITDIYKMSTSDYFVYEDRITQPLTHIVCQVCSSVC